MNYTKILPAIVVAASLCAPQTHASLVELGYSLNNTSNIVTDSNRNLEWLQWDMTTGMSIEEGLAIYSQDGWELASNTQMAHLMNDANLNSSETGVSFDSNESTGQKISSEHVNTVSSAEFIYMFGDTFTSAGYSCCGESDAVEFSRAVFGDENSNDWFNTATVIGSYQSFDGTSSNGYAEMKAESSNYTSTNSHSTYGLALVRSASVSPVPVPASLPMLGLALLGFGLFRSRRQLQK